MTASCQRAQKAVFPGVDGSVQGGSIHVAAATPNLSGVFRATDSITLASSSFAIGDSTFVVPDPISLSGTHSDSLLGGGRLTLMPVPVPVPVPAALQILAAALVGPTFFVGRRSGAPELRLQTEASHACHGRWDKVRH